MSDNVRAAAIVDKVREIYPDAKVRFGSRGCIYEGKGEEILVIDYSDQDIGGPKEDSAVLFSKMNREPLRESDDPLWWVREQHWISDEDLPAPTLKPRSQAVNAFRGIYGILE